ncbi:MAG: nucleotide exchange factor GrpE [Candidatus Loosdrechtia sp.]|uniref:nucleotide exchange factor GrpE n=1 Tax=Candidatus Loosdrechtia sp. TaxID=3101272 RepID=UPI003A61D6A3|nr:MAG: nucleotide exchange factor GrpE [Candidatus Jettenia sp. AMX2]
MSGEEEKENHPDDKVEIVQPSEVLFAEQQVIIQSLKQELDTSKKRIEELKDSIRRLAADFDNYQKRVTKERQDIERTANASLIKKLLDMYESLEKAVCSSRETAENEFREGIKLIYKEFSRILKSEGLEPISAVGIPLDVYRHEVLMRKINDEVPEDTILEEIQKGYLLHNFVLRTAKVVVSQKSKQEDIQNQEKTEEKGG